MLLHIYQIFSSLLGYLYFLVHFFFTFMEQFFIGLHIKDMWSAIRSFQAIAIAFSRTVQWITVEYLYLDYLSSVLTNLSVLMNLSLMIDSGDQLVHGGRTDLPTQNLVGVDPLFVVYRISHVA